VTPTSCRRSPSRPLKAALRRRGPFPLARSPFVRLVRCVVSKSRYTFFFCYVASRNFMSMPSA
jgi:hypothetical protein